MAMTSSVSLNTQAPLPYKDWIEYQDALIPENAQEAYLEYVQSWYKKQLQDKKIVKDSVKQQFIQLAKDLSFLFANAETQDPFLRNIDYNSDENLIYAIPFFAKKLRQIATVLQNKRENVKRAKLKYNLVGSNEGLEKLLYEYVLRGFTNTKNSITQVPASPLINYFPDLSAVKDNFFIELEELHDTQSYFDSDPSVNINQYLDINSLSNTFPLEGLNEEEINTIISTKLLPRVADTPLSNIFKDYVLNTPSLSTVSLSSFATNLVYNEIHASTKYLGEPVYGLTAVRLEDVNIPDVVLNLKFEQGNNWFYWPSGNKILNNDIFNNNLDPVYINNSNFVSSSATGGTNYTNSDLIFTDKNGIVEGAWLQGPHTERQDLNIVVNINGASTRDFIFPFPGIKISSKELTFQGYAIDDTINEGIDKLATQSKVKLLSDYYSFSLPNTSSNSIYINQTTLIDSGAYASEFSPEADNIIKKTKQEASLPIYSEINNGVIDQSYLFKFQRTDLPIALGANNIHWPIQTFVTSSDNLPITIKEDCCLPIILGNINPSYAMVGAVAGFNFSDSDVIYKLNNRGGDPMEAAWLGAGSITNLDALKGAIQIYDTPATKCATYIDGPVQNSCSFKVNGSDKVSFVWMDPDTPADEVFKYVEHLPNCQYGKNYPHNYYKDQDYQNVNPINSLDSWTKCTCKSVQYSPIGHEGNNLRDYNGMADYLFADPEGYGVDFATNTWKDTRGLDVYNSPQFSYYKITGGDKQVGWGKGYWRTGTGASFILKTGKRYTYYRSSLRTDKSSGNVAPYFVSNYAYKNVNGLYSSSEVYDLVIMIDVSKSQSYSLSKVKNIVTTTIDKILNNNKNQVQISVIAFGSVASRLSWLTKNFSALELFVDQLQVSKDPAVNQTDISDALLLAQNILDTRVVTNDTKINNSNAYLASLCNNLGYYIYQQTHKLGTPQNIPQNGKKKILIFSDGEETLYRNKSHFALRPFDDAASIALDLKNDKIEIYGVNIGERSYFDDTVKSMSSNMADYFDLQRYLVSGDGDENSFAEYISMKLGNTISVRPTWYKAIRDVNGNWSATNELSDMIITPGDYLTYVHRSAVNYTAAIINASFITPSISFTVNVKLDGWDYDNSYFTASALGDPYGGKPFWGKVYTSPDSNYNFFKGVNAFGGHVRFFNDYTPLHQPEISSLIFNTGDNIQYVRNNKDSLVWSEPLNFGVSLSSYNWKQLTFKEDYSNLQDFLRSGKLDEIIEDTNLPSYLTLESYSSFKPAYYNYYARNGFNYTQDLYYLNRCLKSFVTYHTGVAIQPNEPYAHLDNVHYPTVATVSFPSQAVSDKQVGEYLLPEKLGTPFYRGKGYSIKLDNESLTYIDSISAERMFLDLEKFGPRNRGLTKKDQISPTKITNITNKWMMEPYSSASKGGVIINTLENQKLTPYQTSYEVYGKNHYGLSRQTDVFEFWTPAIPGTWNNSKEYPLTFRQELPAEQYALRKEKLLTNKGKLDNWRTDIYGNDYGIYKPFSPVDVDGLYMWFSADRGTINQIASSGLLDDIQAEHGSNVLKWMDRSGKNNNLVAISGTPILQIENNIHSIYFNSTSNFTNAFNLNFATATMFIIGSYENIENDYAYKNYQVMASFGQYVSALDQNYVTKGSLAFGQRYGDFVFDFGNNQGWPTKVATTEYLSSVEELPYNMWAVQSLYWSSTGNNSFTVPSRVTSITALVIGGGGAGGGSNTSDAGGQGGGGGGISYTVINIAPGSTIPLKVGSGGLGLSGSAGNPGVASYFGSLTAFGGSGGGLGSAIFNGTMVLGGSGTLSYGSSGGAFGTIDFNALNGVDGYYFLSENTYFGAGGGGGSQSNSLGGLGGLGGGGDGSNKSYLNGLSGVGYGSGGGGGGPLSTVNTFGGNGSNGYIKILWQQPTSGLTLTPVASTYPTTLYEIELTDYYGYVPGFYPPTSSRYMFEAVFNQPYAQAFINGKLYADNKGTLVKADTGLNFDAPLFSTGGFWVGCYVQNSLSTPCKVSEILFYNRALSTEERLNVEKYLNNKYNLY